MRILVWGLGYVGTVSAACLAKAGHDVTGIEPNEIKVEAINSGRTAVAEPDLSAIVADAVAAGRLRAASDGQEHVANSDASLICVGTPSAADGSPVLTHVEDVAEAIGLGLRKSGRRHAVVLRSTVFPGTTRSILLPLLEEHSGKRAGSDFGIAINPEFLREASAVRDFDHPPYTVIGQLDDRSGEDVAAIYKNIAAPLYRVPLEVAEMLKLANNAFHALKIGFANEIGRLCDSNGINSTAVMDLVCADKKLNISTAYLRPGFAFGGSCLPKDLRSISYHARKNGLALPILESVLPSNQQHIEAARYRIHQLGSKRVGILGLSFKAGTDDLRESPVIDLIRKLWQDGIDVLVYDPDVHLEKMLGSNRDYLERQLPQVNQILRANLDEVVEACEAVVVTQGRPEFTKLVVDPPSEICVVDLVRLSEASVMDRPVGRAS